MVDRANLYINQKADFQTPLSFYDNSGPIDMSSYNFYGQIRKIYSSTVLANFKFHLVDLQEGEVEIYLEKQDTEDLPEGKYQYDIIIEHLNGEVTKVLEGLIFILPTITSTGA